MMSSETTPTRATANDAPIPSSKMAGLLFIALLSAIAIIALLAARTYEKSEINARAAAALDRVDTLKFRLKNATTNSPATDYSAVDSKSAARSGLIPLGLGLRISGTDTFITNTDTSTWSLALPWSMWFIEERITIAGAPGFTPDSKNTKGPAAYLHIRYSLPEASSYCQAFAINAAKTWSAVYIGSAEVKNTLDEAPGNDIINQNAVVTACQADGQAVTLVTK